MKTFAIILVFCFAWQWINASRFEDMNTCLLENGFTDTPPDLEKLQAIADPDNADVLKDVSKEKLYDVLVCLYNKQSPTKKLHDSIRSVINRDDKVNQDQIKQMLETLTMCNTKAAGDDVKLLNCINAIDYPFADIMAFIRDFPAAMDLCFEKCKLTIGETYKLEEHRNKLKEIVKHLSEEKLGCFMSCKMDEEMSKIKVNEHLFKDRLEELINRSPVHDENAKNEMLKTLNKCDKQVTDVVEGKSGELIKCLNIFKPPFLDIFG